jgi:hypothetical protein
VSDTFAHCRLTHLVKLLVNLFHHSVAGELYVGSRLAHNIKQQQGNKAGPQEAAGERHHGTERLALVAARDLLTDWLTSNQKNETWSGCVATGLSIARDVVMSVDEAFLSMKMNEASVGDDSSVNAPVSLDAHFYPLTSRYAGIAVASD